MYIHNDWSIIQYGMKFVPCTKVDLGVNFVDKIRFWCTHIFPNFYFPCTEAGANQKSHIPYLSIMAKSFGWSLNRGLNELLNLTSILLAKIAKN